MEQQERWAISRPSFDDIQAATRHGDEVFGHGAYGTAVG
jgi:hypothetical protein